MTVRLRPIDVAHIDELANIGGYGKGRAGVMRRFIENGIAQAIERGVLTRKTATQFGEAPASEDDGED